MTQQAPRDADCRTCRGGFCCASFAAGLCVGAFDFVHRQIGERVGFAIVLAVDVIDAERIERGRHFFGAFVKRREFLAANFVQALHLLDKQFGVALDAQRADSLRLDVVERGDQPVIFGDIVGHAADIFFQPSDDFTFRIADDDAISGWTGITAGAAVDVSAIAAAVPGEAGVSSPLRRRQTGGHLRVVMSVLASGNRGRSGAARNSVGIDRGERFERIENQSAAFAAENFFVVVILVRSCNYAEERAGRSLCTDRL